MSTKGALWLRVPGPEAPMNERIDRIPRQPRVKLASPPWVFLWATRLYSSHLKPWQWASAHGGREKLLSVPQTKVTPFQLSLGNLFFSCCENWSGYRERHTGTVERQKKSLRNIFLLPGGTFVWVGVKGTSLSKRTTMGIGRFFPCWQWLFPRCGMAVFDRGTCNLCSLNYTWGDPVCPLCPETRSIVCP